MLPWSDRKPPRAHKKRPPKPAWLRNTAAADSVQVPTNPQARPTGGNRRDTGNEWEHRAAVWLQERGLQVVHANVQCRAGEIDLICADGQTAVIIEVRRRSSVSHGTAQESIDWHKRKRVTRTALLWWAREGARRFAHLRFDTVTFTDSAHPDWTRHAFDAEGSI